MKLRGMFRDVEQRRKLLIFRDLRSGGMGIRTPGLLIANETLYQLSYTPGLPSAVNYARAANEGKQKSGWD